MYRPLLLLLAVLLAVAAPAAHAQTLPSLEHPALDAHRAHAQRLLRAFPAEPSQARPAATTYVLDTQTRYGLAEFGQPLQAQTQIRYTYSGTLRTSQVQYGYEGGAWVPSWRTVYEYSLPLLVRMTDERWDAEASAFVPDSRTIYTYAGSSGSGLPTAVIYEAWTGTEWVFVERALYTVTGTGTSAYYSVGEFETWEDGAWVPEDRFLLVQSGPDVVITYENWSGTGWEPDSRARYHNITIADLWALERQYEEAFEQYPGILLAFQFPDFTAEKWDGSAWVPESRYTTTVEYAAGTSVILRVINLGEDWDETEGAWLPQSRIVTEYEPITGGSRPASTVIEMWDDEEEEWAGFFEDVYAYDPVSGRMASATTQLSFMGMTMVLARTEFTWRPATGTSTEDGASLLTLQLDAPFPNPTAGAVRLAYRVDAAGPVALRVYDALGRLALTVVEGPLPAGDHHTAFAVDTLPSGLYVIRLETATGHAARALTVAR